MLGPTLCPNVWLPYAPEYVEKPLRERHLALYTNIVPDHWFTVTFIGFGFKNPANIGFLENGTLKHGVVMKSMQNLVRAVKSLM